MLTTQPQFVNQLRRITCDIQEQLTDRSISEVCTLWGMCNSYGYFFAKNAKVLYRDKKTGRWEVNHALVDALLETGGEVAVTIGWMSWYLKTFWENLAYYSERTVEKYRRILCEEFKIFSLEDRDWSVPTTRHRQTNPCSNFNMLRLLVLVSCCEQILKEQGYELEGAGFEQFMQAYAGDWSDRVDDLREDFLVIKAQEKALPEHKGYTLVLLWNAVFQGIQSWQRKALPAGEPRPGTLAALEREFLAIAADERIEELEDPSREFEEIVATEAVEVVEAVVEDSCTESGEVLASVTYDRVLGWFPLLQIARPPRRVAPTRQPPQEQGLTVPIWVREQSDRALQWWLRRLDIYGWWLLELAPDWVLDTYVPF